MERDIDKHNSEHDDRENYDSYRKNDTELEVDEHSTDHRAKDDKRRAHKETEEHIHARLHRVYVARHSRYERRRAELVRHRVAEALYLLEKSGAQTGREAYCGSRGKELRTHRADKSDNAEQEHKSARAPDHARIVGVYTLVDDHTDRDRHEQLEYRLEHLKRRGEEGFFFIVLQKNQKPFQNKTSAK